MGIFDNFKLNFNFGANNYNWFVPAYYVPQFTFPSFTSLWDSFNLSFHNWTFPRFDYNVFSWNPLNYNTYTPNYYGGGSLYTGISTPAQTVYNPVQTIYSPANNIFTNYTPAIEPLNAKPSSITTPDVKIGKKSKPKYYYTPKTNFGKSEGKRDYMRLSQSEAEEKAKNDPNLENLAKLSKGKKWSVSTGTFVTDIPYAKKGTAKILDKVSELTGEELVITSALGTGESGNPHKKGGYDSHHNSENPKLDIRAHSNRYELARKLKSTGYFSRVSVERDHLDVQIDPKKYNELDLMG